MRKWFILFIIALFPLAVSADEIVEHEGLWYNLHDATEEGSSAYAEVTSPQSGSYSGDIVIPSSVKYEGVDYPVTRVGSNAFYSCTEVTSVSLPTSLESIGDYGFYDNYNLKVVDLPEGLTTIGRWAFGYVGDAIDSVKVVLPSTLTSIGECAFRTNNSISVVTSKIQTPFDINENVFGSGISAFLLVPSNTKSAYQALAGWNVFDGIYEGDYGEASDGTLNYRYFTGENIAVVIPGDYSELRSITIPSSVTLAGTTYNVKAVAGSAFKNSYLETLIIENGIETIGTSAFRDSYYLKSVSLPTSLQLIRAYAFQWCNGIKSLTLPEGLKTIEEYAFFNISNLQKLELPSTLDSIEEHAFRGLHNLGTVISKIQDPFEISKYVFGDGSWSYDEETQQDVFTWRMSPATLYVPEGKKSAYQAFEGWNMFAEILEGYPLETTVNGLIYSYLDGKGIATVIGRSDDDMRNISIPGTVPIGDANYIVKTVGAGAFQSCSLDTLVIGEGVETIGKNAFSGNYSLRSLTMPSTLKTIGEYAFNDCGNLKKIELPASLDSIGDYAFYSLDNLSSVISRIKHPFNINENVFCLGWDWDYSSGTEKQVFRKSSATLYVPDNTKSAYQAIDGWNMFADIVEGELKETTVNGLIYSYLDGKGIATVIGRSDNEMYNISIPGSVPIGDATYVVKTVGTGAFESCSLDTLVIGEGVEIIEKNAFRWNYSLRSLTLSSTLKTIGENAFSECHNLKKIELPASLDSIGNYAFYSLGNLSSVISRIQHPFNINQNAFCLGWDWDYSSGTEKQVFRKSSATLYVPDNTMSSYQAIDGWNMFADIIEGELMEGKYEDLYYSYIKGKGKATVINGDYSNLRKVTVPSTAILDGDSYNVTAISAGAFMNCYIDTLVINENVETIGRSAFEWGYNNLKSVTLPNSLRVIGENAFHYCYGIKSLIIPQGVTTIGSNAFNYCNGLQKLELPASLDSIGDYAFRSCSSLSSVTSRIQEPFIISDNVFGVEKWNETEGIYTNEPSNANLYVPEGTKAKYEAIKGWRMFANIYEGELHEVVIDTLKYAYLPGSGTAMVVSGDYEELRNVKIPVSITVDEAVYVVKEIGAGAFQGRYNIESFTINANLETIGKQAFSNCYYATFSDLPTSLRSIGESAFYNCDRIVNFEIPEGVTTIGSETFADCSSMQKIILPSSLISIGEWAFRWCGNLTTVTSRIRAPFAISQSVFCNGANSEWDEDKQQYVTIYQPCGATLCVPEGTLTEYQRFEGWMMFADYVEGELREATVNGLAYIYNVSKKTATVTKGDNYSELRKVEIPANVSIEDVSCKVTGIASRAFSGTYITSVTIEDDGVETIGQEAFQNCSQLGSISLPSSLTSIGSGVFRDCYRLSSILIPARVANIGQSAFAGCKALASIKVADGNSVFESRDANAIIERATNTLLIACKKTVIPTSVTAIGTEAFVNLDIEQIAIPSSVKTIGDNAFNSCHKLTEVVLPEGLETLGNTAFYSCSGLTLVELPKSLKTIGGFAFAECNSLTNVVSNIDEPKDIEYNTFGEYENVYSQATLWVPKGKVSTYKSLEGWSRFKIFDELLYDNLTKPTITYDGHYLVMTNNPEQRAKIYYSTDGSEPTILYSDTVALSNLCDIQAISKRFGSYTVDTARYEVTYVYDGVTARTASGGLLKNAFEWCGTDKIEMLDIDGQLNDEDFATIRGLSKLTVLNMAASKIENSSIPSGAFADMKLEWYVSPYNFTSVGSGIFKGCDKLAALTWNSSSIELPEDVVTDVANPNLLVYAKAQAMIPYAMKNVIVNGVANNIVLVDSAGNNNFRCPEEFLARRITYTHNYQQETKQGQTQGWETLALPFTVSKITHETKGEITPFAVEGAKHPFWLYELGDNGMEKATEIRANTPYLICMPNDDAYGDEYILGGRVTFSATNATITTSGGTTVSRGDRQFVPTYQRVASSSDVYALNVNEVVGDNPVGSVFVPSLREVRPFEAYSVHSTNRARIITVSSLGGGDATGINDLIQNNTGEPADDVVKVYSLSGALIKQGKRDEVLRSLPNGLYIINGKKIIK